LAHPVDHIFYTALNVYNNVVAACVEETLNHTQSVGLVTTVLHVKHARLLG